MMMLLLFVCLCLCGTELVMDGLEQVRRSCGWGFGCLYSGAGGSGRGGGCWVEVVEAWKKTCGCSAPPEN